MLELNKIICWDCLELMKQIPDKSIDLVLTDPPYLVNTSWSKNSTVWWMLKSDAFRKWKVFDNNSIDISERLPEIYRIMKDTAHWYIMCNNKNLSNYLIKISSQWFNIFKTLIWAKNSCICNQFYMDSHEYIIFFRKWWAKQINNMGTRSVLNIDNPRNKCHPTEKPVELMKILIENSTKEWELVFDPFMGWGSTALACQKSKRDFIWCEISEEYVDIANKRLETTTPSLFT